jgi:hypothetical protein
MPTRSAARATPLARSRSIACLTEWLPRPFGAVSSREGSNPSPSARCTAPRLAFRRGAVPAGGLVRADQELSALDQRGIGSVLDDQGAVLVASCPRIRRRFRLRRLRR